MIHSLTEKPRYTQRKHVFRLPRCPPELNEHHRQRIVSDAGLSAMLSRCTPTAAMLQHLISAHFCAASSSIIHHPLLMSFSPPRNTCNILIECMTSVLKTTDFAYTTPRSSRRRFSSRRFIHSNCIAVCWFRQTFMP